MLCVKADQKQVEEIFRQVHCVWPHAEDPEEHLQKRLASTQHKRAVWYAGIVENCVVCSLGAYPYELFGPDGKVKTARVFGAVFTPAAERGQGYASQLLRSVMQSYEAQGIYDFLLYSDIEPQFYEKLGFESVPSYEWCLPVASGAVGEENGRCSGVQRRSLPRPRRGDFSFGFHRSEESSRWLYEKQTGEVQCWVLTGLTVEGEEAYLLSTLDQGTYVLLETNLSQESKDWPLFIDLIESDARRRGAHAARGWWTAAELVPEISGSEILRRDKELLMWRSQGGPSDSWRILRRECGFRAYLSEHV